MSREQAILSQLDASAVRGVRPEKAQAALQEVPNLADELAALERGELVGEERDLLQRSLGLLGADAADGAGIELRQDGLLSAHAPLSGDFKKK